MTFLAFVIKTHSSIRLAEVGEALAALAGLALLIGGMTPFGKRAGQTIGGLALLIGGILLIVATHWGTFR